MTLITYSFLYWLHSHPLTAVSSGTARASPSYWAVSQYPPSRNGRESSWDTRLTHTTFRPTPPTA